VAPVAPTPAVTAPKKVRRATAKKHKKVAPSKQRTTRRR
jgi:hypothetical protein